MLGQGAIAFVLGVKVSSTALTCPDEAKVDARLQALGVVRRDEADVRVRFVEEGGKLVALIDVDGAAPRRLEHDGLDCASLADATVALLSVLLDESERSPKGPAEGPPPPPASPAVSPPPTSRFRADAAAVVSAGIVAPLATGAALGAALRFVPWASVGVRGELWPERANAIDRGEVTVSAWTVALVTCLGPRFRSFSVEGCALGHAGAYSLSGEGFPVVRPTTRGLFGVEAEGRAGIVVTEGVSVFARAGLWVPFTRLDVAARGAASTFETTTVGPKVGLGVELNL